MRTKTVTFLATAAAAVAVAVSGCTQTVTGTAAVTTSDVAAYRAEQAASAAAEMPSWTAVTDQGDIEFSPITKHQVGLTPRPGISIGTVHNDGRESGCTLGPAVWVRGRSGGFITAGHCYGDSGNQGLVACERCDYEALGLLQDATSKQIDRPPDRIDGLVSDSGVILATVPESATSIAGKFPVAGVLTVEGVRDLAPGTPICINGTVSGVVCAPIDRADEEVFTKGELSQGDDSGAVAFVVDKRSGRAALVGIIRGGDYLHRASAITYLAPALERIDAAALLSDGVEPFTGDEFSDRVRTYD